LKRAARIAQSGCAAEANLQDWLGVISVDFMRGQKQIPFGFAQGRLSTHHPRTPPRRRRPVCGGPGTERRLGPRSLSQSAKLAWRDVPGLYARTKADPSIHHPQTERRLGPRSLRMTMNIFV